MKYYLPLLLFFIAIDGFTQTGDINLEKETKETLEWINSKFIEHQFASSDTKQVQSFAEVREISGQYFLMGEHSQETEKMWGFSRVFAIPIKKINSISFIDKEFNVWLEIRMKNNEKVVLETRDGENWTKLDSFAFMLAKSIDKDDLRSRFKEAFKYLMKLYGNDSEEKF